MRMLLLVLLYALVCPPALAQSYPAQPVRVIVPFPAGGTTDIVARLIGQKMAESTGQQFIVENRAGAGGTIGASVVAKAAPDGYTLLVHNIAFVTASAILGLAGRLPYDIEKDFTPVSMLVGVPIVFVAHASVPPNNLRELVAWLKSNPNKTYGSTGPGSMANLWVELYKSGAGVEIQHIPFKGAAPAMQDLMVGRIDMMIDQLTTALPHIRSGKIKPIAVADPARNSALPEVRTAREQGFPELEASNWNSLFGPAGLPPAVVQRLHAEAVKAIRHPDVAKRLQDMSAEGVAGAPADFDKLFRSQIGHWTPVVKKLGIKPD